MMDDGGGDGRLRSLGFVARFLCICSPPLAFGGNWWVIILENWKVYTLRSELVC